MKFFKKAVTAAIAGMTLAACLGGASANTVQAASTKQIDNYIKKASLRQKIGQMFIARTPQKLGQAERDAYQYNLGGYIVYDADMQNYTDAQFKSKIANYQKAAQLPLLIGIDQEGGSVSRLTHGGLAKQNGDEFKFPRDQYEDAENAQKGSGMKAVVQYARENATLLHKLGINWNYAPDADYSDDPSSFIYQRGFGGVMGKNSYRAVANYIKQVVPAWQHNHLVAATLKHFPGYGDAADTHTGFAHVTKTKSQLMKSNILPFKAGIKAGADSVMVTHVIYDKIDPVYPASLSKKIITMLRKDCNFKGVIVTDALEMGAIQDFAKKHGNESVEVLAVKAGNDMLMSADYAKAIPAIEKAVKKGKISKKQIDRSVKRILTMKKKLGILSASDLQVKKNNKRFFKLNSVTYKNGLATVSGTAKKDAKVSLISTDTKKGKNTNANKKGQFKINVPLQAKAQNFILSSDGYLSVNVHMKAAKKTTVKKTITLNKVKYNKKHTVATISGKVSDPGEEGSLTIVMWDAKTNKTLNSVVVGKDGKFSATVLTSKKEQKVMVDAQNNGDYSPKSVIVKRK